MKRMIIICILLMSMNVTVLPFLGSVNETQILGFASTTVVQRIQCPFFATQLPYVSSGSGGFVAIYPASFFPLPPLVLVSVTLNGSSNPLDTYLAVVSANSSTSTTVTVYKVALAGGGVFTEAADGEVDVSMLALNNDGT
jgi:hypothetical protein